MRVRRRVGIVTATVVMAVASGITATAAQAEALVASTGGPAPQLVVIDSATPQVPVLGPVPLVGLGAGESLVGIDYRPSNGILYAVTKDGANVGRLYTIRIDSGGLAAQASQVNGLAFGLGPGTTYGIDWTPVVDRLRIVSDLGLNLRINPDNLVASIQADTALAYDAGDPNVGQNPPNVAALAYSNNTAGATSTTAFTFAPGPEEILATLGSPGGLPISPNSGLLFTIRTTASTTNGDQGLDIAPDGTAFMSATNAGNAFLIEVDLTAPAGQIGNTIADIGTDANEYRHISVIPAGIFSIDDAVVREADGGYLVTVRRRGGSVGDVQVDFDTADGTATDGQDYTAINGTFTFADGQDEDTVFVPITQDPNVEGDETILLQLSNPTGGAVIAGDGVLTIDDDDSNPPPPPPPPADAPPAKCKGIEVTISGTPAAETIEGTPGPDVIAGFAGEDTILGRGGDDKLCGGKADDVIRGGAGDDALRGGFGTDDCRGGSGSDSASSCGRVRSVP